MCRNATLFSLFKKIGISIIFCMKVEGLKINRHLENVDLELISHILLIAVLLLVSVWGGMTYMPEQAVQIGKKESVQRAEKSELKIERDLITNADIPVMMVNENKIINEVTTDEKQESIVPIFSCEGKLRNDYCVGSKIDLSSLSLFYGGEKILLEDCEVTSIDTSTAGTYVLTITYKGDSVEIPYGVMEYQAVLHGYPEEKIVTLDNYMLDIASLEEPLRLGKRFAGWYEDEACSIPFAAADYGEVLIDLYPAWQDFDRFACDEEGYINAYTGGYGSITDGLLNLIAHPSCIGVRAYAFFGMEEIVTDIYVPANIVDIEAGAFDALPYVFYIYVEPSNPSYCSVDGVLYTKDMNTIVAYPQGR